MIRNRNELLISGKIGYNKSWRYPLMLQFSDKKSQLVIDSGKIGYNKSWRYPLMSQFSYKKSQWVIDKRQNWV